MIESALVFALAQLAATDTSEGSSSAIPSAVPAADERVSEMNVGASAVVAGIFTPRFGAIPYPQGGVRADLAWKPIPPLSVELGASALTSIVMHRGLLDLTLGFVLQNEGFAVTVGAGPIAGGWLTPLGDTSGLSLVADAGATAFARIGWPMGKRGAIDVTLRGDVDGVYGTALVPLVTVFVEVGGRLDF